MLFKYFDRYSLIRLSDPTSFRIVFISSSPAVLAPLLSIAQALGMQSPSIPPKLATESALGGRRLGSRAKKGTDQGEQPHSTPFT